MAIFHVDAMVIHKTHANPGAAGLSQYLRSGAGDLRRYMERAEPGREDLVEYGEAGLPSWATNGTHFFAMANQFEARKDGVVGRHYQFSLPRELDNQARKELAADIRAVFFAQYPHVYAIHAPLAKDRSGEQPHLHVLLSPRRDDGLTRTPKKWFAGLGHDARHPEGHRVPIDRTWGEKRTLQGVRYEYAILANAALEREGIAAAISSQRLEARGLGRRGTHYHPWGQDDRTRAIRGQQAALHRNGTHAIEQLVNLEAWRRQKRRESIRDLSRDAVVDFTRDRFWRHDQSETRERERQASLLRAVAREYGRAGQERTMGEQERTKGREKSRQWQSPFSRAPEDGARQGVHVHFDRESP